MQTLIGLPIILVNKLSWLNRVERMLRIRKEFLPIIPEDMRKQDPSLEAENGAQSCTILDRMAHR